MHNIHFIKLHADDCEDAMSQAESYINIENSSVDYFHIVMAYNLLNPSDYMKRLDDDFRFNSILGDDPINYTKNVVAILNENYKPFDVLKEEIAALLSTLNEETIKSSLPFIINAKAKEFTGCYPITDIIAQAKYEYDWEEVGLTYFDGCSGDPTHLVLVDFHS